MLLSSDTTGLEIKAKFFRGFGDPSRLKILESLRDTPRTVSQIVEVTGLSQSNVSNHLRCLRGCGLVTAQKQSRYVIYRLSDDRVAELLALAESLLADVARGVYQCTRYSQATDPLHPDRSDATSPAPCQEQPAHRTNQRC